MVDIVTRLGKGSPLTNAEVDANFTNLAEVSGVTGEPMGHEDRTTSTISFNASTRTFTIAPTASSFTVWCKGKKVVVSSAQTVVIPNTTGMHSIYYDANGTLSSKLGYFTFSTEAPTAYVYWNATTGAAPYFGDERHGVVLDWQTHEYLHRTRGAALASGFSASGYVLGGNGSSNSHAQITLEGGTFFDEDMKIIVTATNTPTAGTWEQDLLSPARIPVLYLSGTAWVIDSPTDYPLKQGTARPQYNAFSGGVWSTADVANNKYATSWILATNNLTYPVIAIIGQAESDLQSAAEAVDFTALQLPSFPSVEFRPLYKLIFQCADSCTNAVHASLVSITDIRSIAAAGTAASIVTDHGNLSGLSDDDHPQYLSVDTVRGSLTAAVKASFLPSQTSNAGKFLQTDGTATSWQALTSGNVTTALGFTPYNATNPSGFITGITSGNVTTALGFTPYNATNPSGYVTAAGARGSISVTGAGSYDSATGVINIVGGVTSFNTRTGAITLSSADVTTALGFTPYNSTNPNGYLTGITSTQVTTALGYTPYNSSNPSGYITGITSGMVTTALGFTPYNNSNPSGYITSAALSPYLTTASAASTYLALSGGTLTGRTSISFSGMASPSNTAILPTSLFNLTGGGGDWLTIGQYANSNFWLQASYSNPSLAYYTIALNPLGGNVTMNGNTVLNAGNYNSYSPTLTGGGASGTWGINVTGTASGETLSTVTGRGGVTSNAVNLANGSNRYQGHFYYDPYDSNGNHYPHFTDGGNASGVKINWRLYTGGTNSVTHYWGTDTAQFVTKLESTVRVDAPIFYDRNDTAYYINPNGSSQVSGSNFNFGAKGRLYDDGNFHIDGLNSPVWINSISNEAIYLNSQTSGFTQMGNSARAPIFYDSNNTAYYVDPSSTSYMNSVRYVRGAHPYFERSVGVDVGAIGWHTNDSFYVAGHPGYGPGAGNDVRVYGFGNSLHLGNATYGDVLTVANGYTQGTGSIRAPVFYDSNDTAYYGDFNNTSVFSKLWLNGKQGINGGVPPTSGTSTPAIQRIHAGYPSYGEVLDIGMTIGPTYAWIQATNYSDLSVNYNLLLNPNGGSVGVGVTNAAPAAKFHVRQSAPSSIGGMPSGVTMLSDSSTNNYLLFRNTADNGTYGGIAFQDNNIGGYVVFGNAGGGGDLLYVAGYGGGQLQYGTADSINPAARTTVASWNTTGLQINNGDMRAPIYYDSNDTSYYIDSNNTSVMYQINMWGRLATDNPLDYSSTSVTGLTSAPLAANAIYDPSVGSTSRFLPLTHQTALHSGGYRTHLSTGLFKHASGWGDNVTGWYAALGNSDSSPTMEWRLTYGTDIYNSVGYVSTPSSFRAPIFYDSNNTSYYVDPASATSGSFAGFVGIGNNYGSDDGGWGSRLNVGGGPHARIDVRCANDGIVTTMYSHAGQGVGKMGMMSNHPLVLMAQGAAEGGSVYSGSLRSAIFYDSNDTSFYLDPNGTSVLNVLNAPALSDSPLYLRTRGDSNHYLWNAADDWEEMVMYFGTGFRVSNSAGNGTLLYCYGSSNGNHVYTPTSFRAPIFYDSNDTTYYIDPASSTYVFGGITNSGAHGNSWIQNRLLPGNNGASTGEVQLRMWCSEPNVSWDWGGFGYNVLNDGGAISGFGRPNTSFGQAYMRMSPAGNWYFYNTNTGGTRYETMVLTNSGNVEANYSIRAPIFYDLNNTAYYVDPNGGSRTGGINADSLYSYGNVTAYSDERLKTDWENLPSDFVAQLAKVKSGTYTRIDSGERQVGVGAQSLQAILKEAVSDKEQYLGVNYGNAALASAVELAKDNVELRARIERLESLINKLIGD